MGFGPDLNGSEELAVLASLAQIAAWKWEWQGALSSLVMSLAFAFTRGGSDVPLLLFVPSLLFILHYVLARLPQATDE
jgi:hypothetical protein